MFGSGAAGSGTTGFSSAFGQQQPAGGLFGQQAAQPQNAQAGGLFGQTAGAAGQAGTTFGKKNCGTCRCERASSKRYLPM